MVRAFRVRPPLRSAHLLASSLAQELGSIGKVSAASKAAFAVE